MPQDFTETSSPDWGMIEQGDPRATADAIALIYQLLMQEKVTSKEKETETFNFLDFLGFVQAAGPGDMEVSHPPVSDSALVTIAVSITDAQIRALGGTPVTIVAAPGTGKIIVPLAVHIEKDTSAGAYVGNPSLVVRYSGIATNLTNAAFALSMTSTTDAAATHTGSYDLLNAAPSNTSLVLTHTAAEMTGGNAANSLRVTVAYYLADAL